MSAQICQHCGAPISTDANFCGRCGNAFAEPGFQLEKHYTEYTDNVQRLVKENRLDDAEKLLIELVNATEREAHDEGLGVAPWYYERLAMLYRKKKDRGSETRILERFAGQKHAPGAKADKLMARLQKLEAQ